MAEEMGLEAQFEQGHQERMRQFSAPRPKEELRENEVNALAEAIEDVMLEASDGQVQPGGDVALEIGSGMQDGKITPQLFGALEMLSEFLDLAGKDHPELGKYSFDHKRAVMTREGVLQTAASLKELANDRRAMGRMKTYAPEEAAPQEAEAAPPENEIDVSSLFGGSDGE